MRFYSAILIVGILVSLAFSQENQEKKVPPHPTRNSPGPSRGVNAAPEQFAQRSKFAVNVLESAVAIPENDPQDRLRVLVAAVRLANSVSPARKKSLSREGIELESRLIGSGQQPRVSMVEAGFVDCAAISGLIEVVRPEAMLVADRTVAAAVGACPKQTLEAVERKLSDALQHNSPAPLSLMAAMRMAGAKSNWTLQVFDAIFSGLPDPKTSAPQAQQLAAVYEDFAPAVDAASARAAGAKLLLWIAKMNSGPEQVQAATTATRAVKKVLGAQRFQEIIESDPIARQAAQLAGQPTQMTVPHEEAQVAIGKLDSGQDHTGDLQNLPAPRRAHEAAAYGIAVGGARHPQLAQRYFDIAFSALNELWANQLPGMDVAATVEEVSQAAANVDPVAALKRAQSLQDNSAQAISMLAVAQTVVNRQAESGRPKIAEEKR